MDTKDENTAHAAPAGPAEPQGTPIIVTKDGEEGSIEVDRITGIVLTKVDQRPVWGESLACAMLAERAGWYAQRLGPKHELSADNILFDDLGWVALDQEGQEVEVEANPEHRMTLLADALGVDREDPNFGTIVAEVEMDMEPATLSAEDQASLADELQSDEAFTKAQAEGSRD